jgi:transcriptional regulator with XRE-family HTH domain
LSSDDLQVAELSAMLTSRELLGFLGGRKMAKQDHRYGRKQWKGHGRMARHMGAKLQELREAAGISRRELGDSVRPRLERESIRRMEAGQTVPDLGTIESLADYFNVPPGYFFPPSWKVVVEGKPAKANNRPQLVKKRSIAASSPNLPVAA